MADKAPSPSNIKKDSHLTQLFKHFNHAFILLKQNHQKNKKQGERQEQEQEQEQEQNQEQKHDVQENKDNQKHGKQELEQQTQLIEQQKLSEQEQEQEQEEEPCFGMKPNYHPGFVKPTRLVFRRRSHSTGSIYRAQEK